MPCLQNREGLTVQDMVYPRIDSTDVDVLSATYLVVEALSAVAQRMTAVAWKRRLGEWSGPGPRRY